MGKKGGGDGGAGAARAEELARQERIRSGTQRIDDIFGQNFTDDFYDARKSSYVDYATPQLEDQYEKAVEDLTFSLTRSGTLDSSDRAQKFGELEKLYGRNKQAVADQGLNFENSARTSIEDARADLIRTLNASGDAEGAASSALNRSSALSAPDAYSPLGQMFSAFTAQLGNQSDLEKAAAYTGGLVKPRYNTGLFAPNLDAVKNTP